MMKLVMIYYLFLFLVTSLVHSSLSADTLKVPGVTIGWSIDFIYTGKNIRRATLSVEDSIGKSLHLELRHNEGCTDNPSPEILFNTKTNGQFDSAVTKELTELSTGQWIVEAKEDHWLIKKKKCGWCDDYAETFTFDYRSPHTLSDVKVIRLYATTCNGGMFLGRLSGIYQLVSASFSQIHIKGRCEKTFPQMRFFFKKGEGKYLGYSLSNDDIEVRSPKFSSRKLTKPITEETFDEVILQNIGGGKYKMTITVGDQETFEYVGDLSSYDIDQNWVVTIYLYLEITKFEIQY